MDKDEFWALVDAGPTDFSRDQRILFWWVVMLLPSLKPHGTLLAPQPAPLTAEEIKTVFYRLLPKGERSGTVSYMDQIWNYEEQNIIVSAFTGEVISLSEGLIEIVPVADPYTK